MRFFLCITFLLSPAEPVVVVALKLTKNKCELIDRANKLFDIVEVQPHTRCKLPSQISGGRAQRVGIVRALINTPEVLFADEPTGALNSKKSLEVLDTFSRFNREGQSIVMVTHDLRSALRGNRIIYLRDGKVLGECNLPSYDGDNVERRKKLSEFLEKMDW